MPLEPHSDGKNSDLMRKFKIFRQLRKQGFRDAIPDRDAGATVYSERVSPCDSLFPPRVGGQGG